MGNIKVEEKMWSYMKWMIKVPNQNITHHSKAINTKLDSDPLNLEVWNFGELNTTISEWSVFLFTLIISGEIGKVARSS